MHPYIPSLLLAALIATLTALPAPAAVAGTPSLQAQRQAFLDARRAVKRGQMKRFHQLSRGLEGYLLYPYLRYEELRRNLAAAKTKEIAAFLEAHDGEAVAILLRRHWLDHLAKSKRWKAYLAFYRPDYSATRHCHYLEARLRSGKTDGLWQEVEETWLVGKSQPNACDPAFDAWRAAGGMTREQVLKRIQLAMDHRRLSLVTYLAKLLPKKEAAWVHRWQRLHRNPDKELDKLTAGADPEWRARLFAYGVKRLAIRDEEKALEVWRKRAGEFALSDELKAATERSLGLRLAYRHHPQADEVLAGLPGADDETRQWRIANHIWHHEWPELLGALDALPEEEAKEDRWRYWRARAMEGIGNHAEAQRLYAAAAAGNGYYSFLAAEHAGQSPQVHNEPLPVQPWVLDQLAKQPAMQRARELFELNLSSDADREWYYFTKDLDVETKRAAAKLAERWGWHHRAILTVARTGHLDDLELRFPTPYREPILNSAKQAKLDPAMVYALIRQESAFKRDARSPVGALGLMQLMPATAKRTGQLIKRPVRSNWEILDASTNIRLGTSHLNHLMHQYNDNRIFTAVAYNAGPHRIRKWLPEDEAQPADAWIEGVPFDETRGYIKRILSYTLIYEWRLGRPLTPLSKHMPEIEPRS
ncbi:transglycosylase SLT domain-containing protein [Endothiovibrio diazotrophicus]